MKTNVMVPFHRFETFGDHLWSINGSMFAVVEIDNLACTINHMHIDQAYGFLDGNQIFDYNTTNTTSSKLFFIDYFTDKLKRDGMFRHYVINAAKAQLYDEGV